METINISVPPFKDIPSLEVLRFIVEAKIYLNDRNIRESFEVRGDTEIKLYEVAEVLFKEVMQSVVSLVGDNIGTHIACVEFPTFEQMTDQQLKAYLLEYANLDKQTREELPSRMDHDLVGFAKETYYLQLDQLKRSVTAKASSIS